MIDAALIATTALIGLAGAPHCTAMCSAPCAVALQGGGRSGAWAFHAARVAAYAAAGAVAASSVGALAAWARLSPGVQPLWALMHAAIAVLGASMLWRGRAPVWLSRIGRVPAATVTPPATIAFAAAGGAATPRPRRAPALRGAAAGALWVAWPCGLLQSALLVAAMADSAGAGAATMGAFALASSPGLLLGPWALRRWLRGRSADARQAWAVRAAGAMLLAASTWALGHGLWGRVAAFCGAA